MAAGERLGHGCLDLELLASHRPVHVTFEFRGTWEGLCAVGTAVGGPDFLDRAASGTAGLGAGSVGPAA